MYLSSREERSGTANSQLQYTRNQSGVQKKFFNMINEGKYFEQVGIKIRMARVEKGMTQLQLADQIGNQRAQRLQRIEAGETNFGIYTLYKISQALKIPLAELLDIKI